jgi:general stress protein YciG
MLPFLRLVLFTYDLASHTCFAILDIEAKSFIEQLGHLRMPYFQCAQIKRDGGSKNAPKYFTSAHISCLGFKPGKGLDMLPEDEDEKPTPPMTTAEAGRKGGSTVRDKYGEDYYRRIGKKGGTTLKEQRGSEYYREIAQKGGQANVEKYGPDHFSEMGKKGGNTTKQRQDPDFYSRIGKLGGAAKRQKKST